MERQLKHNEKTIRDVKEEVEIHWQSPNYSCFQQKVRREHHDVHQKQIQILRDRISILERWLAEKDDDLKNAQLTIALNSKDQEYSVHFTYVEVVPSKEINPKTSSNIKQSGEEEPCHMERRCVTLSSLKRCREIVGSKQRKRNSEELD